MPDVTAGSKLTNLFPPTKYSSDGTSFNVTSDTFTTGGHPLVAFTFLTNSLGKISVAVNGIAHGASGTRVDLSYEIYVGSDASGTVVSDASILERGASSSTDTKNHAINRGPILHTGLAVNATHYARLVHKRDGSSGSAGFERRGLWIAPAF